MTATSPKICGTSVDDASIGTTAWANPGNATADDGVYAVASVGLAQPLLQTHYLKTTNYGFAVPSNAVIVGVLTETKCYFTTLTGGDPVSAGVNLVKGGIVSGNANSFYFPSGVGNIAWMVAGSSNDLWGLPLTPANVNASDFGVTVRAVEVPFAMPGAGENVYVDAVRVTVYYIIPSPFSRGYLIAP